MISYHSNNFEVVINMSQVPIELSPPPPHARMGGGGEIAQLILQNSIFLNWLVRAKKGNCRGSIKRLKLKIQFVI